MSGWIDVVFAGVPVAVITVGGSLMTGRAGARSAKEGQRLQNDLDWRKQLTAELKEVQADSERRVSALEDRIAKLEARGAEQERVLGLLGDFLDDLALFETYGRSSSEYPVPPLDASSYYNRDRWMHLKARHDAGRTDEPPAGPTSGDH